MIVPEPLVAPDTPDCTTVQLKLALVSVLVNVMVGAVPVQIDAELGVAVTFGTLFTVIFTGTAAPAQPA